MWHRGWWGLGIFIYPGAALATESEALDLRSGAVGDLTATTLSIGHGLLAFLLILGLALQLLRGPGQPRHYLAVVWRTLLVLALLQAYTFLAGSLVKECASLSRRLAKAGTGDPLEDYRSAVTRRLAVQAGEANASAEASGSAPPHEARPPGLGGVLFDVVIGLVVLLAGAIHWVFTELSRILISFFYVIGPMALAFYVPGLDAPGRWLRSLVTVSCWPVVSSLLLNLSTAVVTQAELATTGAGAAFGAVASSLLLCVLALATPKIASALVGGVSNLLGEGARTALRVAAGAAAAGLLP